MGTAAKKCEPEKATEQVTRRSFLGWLSGVSIAGSALAGAFSGLIFMKPRATYGEPNRFRIGRPEEFPAGARIAIDTKRVCIVREGNKVAAISTTCTHLGCIVAAIGYRLPVPLPWLAFDVDGNVTGGPAPKALVVVPGLADSERRTGSGQGQRNPDGNLPERMSNETKVESGRLVMDFPRNVWKSIFRNPLPSSDRGRAATSFTNFFLHIQPVRVSRQALRPTYTMGLGLISFFLFCDPDGDGRPADVLLRAVDRRRPMTGCSICAVRWPSA